MARTTGSGTIFSSVRTVATPVVRPVLVSHRRSVPSRPNEARRLPSVVRARPMRPPLCPSSGGPDLPSAAQERITPSSPPAQTWPSGATARATRAPGTSPRAGNSSRVAAFQRRSERPAAA